MRITLPAATSAKLAAEGVEPIALLRFKNQIEPWNSLTEPESGLDKIGDHVRVDYRFIRAFDSNQINYRGYPFGTLPLQLTLIPVPAANGAIRAYPFDPSGGAADHLPVPIRINVNRADSSVSRSSNMDGYQLRQWRFVA